MAQDQKIVAVGPRPEILGLRGIGVEILPVDGPEGMLKVLRQQVREAEVKLMIVSESVCEGTREQVQDLRREHGKPILLVPSHRGAEGVTLEWMREEMEQSIGVDLISEQ